MNFSSPEGLWSLPWGMLLGSARARQVPRSSEALHALLSPSSDGNAWLKVKWAQALLFSAHKAKAKLKPVQEEAGTPSSPGLSFFPASSIPEGSYKAIWLYCHPRINSRCCWASSRALLPLPCSRGEENRLLTARVPAGRRAAHGPLSAAQGRAARARRRRSTPWTATVLHGSQHSTLRAGEPNQADVVRLNSGSGTRARHLGGGREAFPAAVALTRALADWSHWLRGRRRSVLSRGEASPAARPGQLLSVCRRWQLWDLSPGVWQVHPLPWQRGGGECYLHTRKQLFGKQETWKGLVRGQPWGESSAPWWESLCWSPGAMLLLQPASPWPGPGMIPAQGCLCSLPWALSAAITALLGASEDAPRGICLPLSSATLRPRQPPPCTRWGWNHSSLPSSPGSVRGKLVDSFALGLSKAPLIARAVWFPVRTRGRGGQRWALRIIPCA